MNAVRRFAREDVVPALAPWVVSRAIVLVALAVARDLGEQLRLGLRAIPLRQGLFAWDAAYYRDIAQGGYDAVAEAGLRFFPGLPLLVRALAWPIGGRVGPVLIVVVNLAALLYAGALHRLVLEETADRGLARRTVWLALLVPPALCFVFGYSEAVFGLLAVLVFLAARRRRWWWAAAAAFAASLTRPTGVLLVAPLVIEALAAWRATPEADRRIAGVLRPLVAVLAPAAGLLAFLGWSAASGRGFLTPLQIQSSSQLRGGFVAPWTALRMAGSNLGSGDRLGSGLHLVWAIVVIACVVAVARRLPTAYWVWAALSVAVALSAPNLDSFERYAVATFPVLIGAGILTARPRDLFPAVLAAAGAGMFGATYLVLQGRLVP